jgi:hypothetical protein
VKRGGCTMSKKTMAIVLGVGAIILAGLVVFNVI